MSLELVMLRPSHRLMALVVLLLSSLFLVACSDKEKPNAAGAGGPVEVGVVKVTAADVPLVAELPGRTSAFRKAEVRPQVSGIIQKRLFAEGASIKAGTALYQIDPASYDAALSSARAEQARAEANLAAATARESRYKNLITTKSISQQDYDDALAALGQANANLALAKAAVKTAQINLNYTKVLAPIDGVIGKSSVTEGALVTAGQTDVLAEIQQLDPIYVDVSQSAEALLQLRRQMLKGAVASSDKSPVQLIFGDGSVYEHKGYLQFAEVGVSESTGTVTLRAQFPNPDRLLLPGMFVRTRIEEGQRSNAVLVSQRGVIRDRTGGATIWIINAEGKAEIRNIKIGSAVGDQWLVLEGLSEGEQVIVEGLQKIKPGVSVTTVTATTAVNQE
jgi:membrane fusion protein, multidrug efflux system